jgi:hypothetical protein
VCDDARMNARLISPPDPDVEFDDAVSIIRFPKTEELQTHDLQRETNQNKERTAQIIDLRAAQDAASTAAQPADDEFEIDREIRSILNPGKHTVVLSDPLEDALFFCWAIAAGIVFALALVC